MNRFEKLTLVLAFVALLPPSLEYYTQAAKDYFNDPEIQIEAVGSEFLGISSCCFEFKTRYRIHNLSKEKVIFDFIGAYAQDVETQFAEVITPYEPFAIEPRSFIDVEVESETSVSEAFLPTFTQYIKHAVGEENIPAIPSRQEIIAEPELAGKIFASMRGVSESEYGKHFGKTFAGIYDSYLEERPILCDEKVYKDPSVCMYISMRTVENVEYKTELRLVQLNLIRSSSPGDFFVNFRGWSPQ